MARTNEPPTAITEIVDCIERLREELADCTRAMLSHGEKQNSSNMPPWGVRPPSLVRISSSPVAQAQSIPTHDGPRRWTAVQSLPMDGLNARSLAHHESFSCRLLSSEQLAAPGNRRRPMPRTNVALITAHPVELELEPFSCRPVAQSG